MGLLKQRRENPPYFSHTNKGFINYIFCRNWAVRNPAGTRLDSSSLVNKQVDDLLARLIYDKIVTVFKRLQRRDALLFLIHLLLHCIFNSLSVEDCPRFSVRVNV